MSQAPVKFPTFDGNVVKRPDQYQQKLGYEAVLDEYTVHSFQYATTHKQDVCLPAAVIYATNEEDVKRAIGYATAAGVAVAVRSGGHHYNGASSTTGNNIQLDMSAFNQFSWSDTTGIATCGVAVSIGMLASNLAKHDAFVPHGQCLTVCLGGHMQSGGFSPHNGRSFGLLADHVLEFRIITADQQTRVITRPRTKEILNENDELWSVVMGGSPGNFGVVTEMKIKALFDKDYPEARVATYYTKYTPEAYTAMMQLLAEYNDDDDLPADFNVSVVNLTPYVSWMRPQLNTMMNVHTGVGATAIPAHLVSMWVSWYNLDGGEYTQAAKDFFAHVESKIRPFVYTPTIIDKLAKSLTTKVFSNVTLPQSTSDQPIKPSWVSNVFAFPNRVYGTPMVGGNWISDLTNLSTNGFVSWAVDNMNSLRELPGVHSPFEFVVLGGKHSKNVVNGELYPHSINGRTHEEMRTFALQIIYYDSTDAFHQDWPEPREHTHAWFAQTKKDLIGTNGLFATKDRRFKAFANCIDDYNLDERKEEYFGDESKYQTVLQVKRKVDPNEVFTPNLFCVGASLSDRFKKAGAAY